MIMKLTTEQYIEQLKSTSYSVAYLRNHSLQDALDALLRNKLDNADSINQEQLRKYEAFSYKPGHIRFMYKDKDSSTPTVCHRYYKGNNGFYLVRKDNLQLLLHCNFYYEVTNNNSDGFYLEKGVFINY